MGFLRGKAAAVCLAPPTFNLQPFLRLWADYVHGSLWADGAGSASRAGNVPFLNENQGGAGKKGPILLQIKSFTNDGKLVQIKTFLFFIVAASDLPPVAQCSATGEALGFTVDLDFVLAAFLQLFMFYFACM